MKTRFLDYFTWKFNGQTHFGDWHELDDYDKEWLKDFPLKEGETLMRYSTEKMLGGAKHLIKVNYKKQLVYFLTEWGAENGAPVFETRGVKAHIYLNEKFTE